MLPEVGGVDNGRGPAGGGSGSLRDPQPVRALRAGPQLLAGLRQSGAAAQDPPEQGAGPFPRVLLSPGEDAPSPPLGAAQRHRTGRTHGR